MNLSFRNSLRDEFLEYIVSNHLISVLLVVKPFFFFSMFISSSTSSNKQYKIGFRRAVFGLVRCDCLQIVYYIIICGDGLAGGDRDAIHEKSSSATVCNYYY